MKSNSDFPESSINQLKLIRQLKQKKYRYKYKNFICEGIKICGELIKERPDLVEIVLVSDKMEEKHSELLSTFGNLPIYHTDNLSFEKVASLDQSDGILIMAKFREVREWSTDDYDFAYYTDQIQDPGNLGTIFRISDWYGQPQLFIGEGTVDPYNPKVIQASMGSIWRVNWHVIVINELIEDHIVIGSSLKGSDGPIPDDKRPKLVILGNESQGMKEEIYSVCDHLVKIEGASLGAESLNVAISAAILGDRLFSDKT